MTSVSVNC